MKQENLEWSKAEIKLLTKLRPTLTVAELVHAFDAKGFSRSPKAIERKCAGLGLKYIKVSHKGVNVLEDVEDKYELAWEKILALKQDYLDDYEYRKVGVMPEGKATRKILTISDLHIPFDREDLVRDIIEEHSDADILVVNGDMLDLHAVSTWPKERSVVLRKEYDIAMKYMELFSETFPRVVLTRGNHEYRLNRYFNTNLDSSVSFMVSKDILARLALGEVYDNDGNVVERKNFSNIHFDAGLEAWFVKIGKTVFLHPLAFSTTEGKTTINAQTYFMERTDIDCVVTAHTHSQALIPARNKLCIEQGCLCCPLDYEKQGKLKYKAMTLGYAVVYQDAEGNCDFNKTRTYYLGTQYPLKNDLDLSLDLLKR